MRPGDAVSLIEAAYALDFTTEQWLEQISAAGATALGSSRGAMAFRYDAASGDWVHVRATGLFGLPPEFLRDFFNHPGMPPEAVMAMAQTLKSIRFGSTRATFEGLGFKPVCDVFDRYGIDDMVGVNGLDPSGCGCMVLIADEKRHPSPRTVHVWHRLAAHVSAGNRLRLALDSLTKNGADVAQQAEAVLAPNGKIEHATGPAEARAARKALRDALVRIDAARSESNDARRSVDLWPGLIAGRWSLVEHFERDGRRYFFAHKNDPELVEDRALTLRERQVFGYAELGHSNKLIGYELGLSSSAVSTALARARRKLGIGS